MMQTCKLALLTAVLLGGNVSVLPAGDWPMFGRDATRNAVSPEAGPPVTWDVESGRNVKWSAPLGSSSYGDPVVANGLVWVGTNNASLKPGERRTDAAVLMCFREADGELLYRYVSSRLPQGRVHDWPLGSLACSPLIEADRMWFTTNRAEVVCFDIGPLHRGNAEPKTVWKLDMIEQLGVFPRGSLMNIARLCSPAVYKDWIYVITGNGVDISGIEVPRPDAPSLVCLEKATGRVVWTDNSPGENILHGQWASPLAAEIDGRAQVVTPQGDGWLRSFDAATGELIWKFDMNRKDAKWFSGGGGTRNYVLATPVLYENRIYITGGRHPEHGEGPGRLVCIDPTKTGDLSADLAVDAAGEVIPHRRIQAVDPAQGERAVANPGSGLIWEFTEQGDDSEDAMRRSVSSVAVHKGLAVAGDISGRIHCLDARTGEKHWTHDSLAGIHSAPLIVDDTIYVADEDGKLTILRLATEKQVLGEISHDHAAYCAPIFANGVLYVATNRRLYAIRDEQNGAREGRTAPDNIRLAAPASRSADRLRPPRSVFVPTPSDVVTEMLALAEVKQADVVYDLGSGDGRMVIAAAKRYGSRAVGYEIDTELVELSRDTAEMAGVGQLVTIRHEDMFTADLSQADVVALYLVPKQLEALLPQLQKLKPGSRIVSHHFEIPGVEPDQVITMESAETEDRHTLYLWTTPLKVAPPRPE